MDTIKVHGPGKHAAIAHLPLLESRRHLLSNKEVPRKLQAFLVNGSHHIHSGWVRKERPFVGFRWVRHICNSYMQHGGAPRLYRIHLEEWRRSTCETLPTIYFWGISTARSYTLFSWMATWPYQLFIFRVFKEYSGPLKLVVGGYVR